MRQHGVRHAPRGQDTGAVAVHVVDQSRPLGEPRLGAVGPGDARAAAPQAAQQSARDGTSLSAHG